MSDLLQTPPRDWLRALTDLLERQRSMVDRLAELARRQSALVESGDTEALLSLLAQRQGIIDQFVATQDDLAPLTRGLQERLSAVAEDDRRRVGAIMDQINDALADVMRCDEQDQQAMQDQRDQIRDGLAGVGTSRQARRAYLGAKAVNNRFADRQG